MEDYTLAIIVPYRDRRDHLDVFLPHMDEFLSDKNIDYTIFVIEQADDKPFNYGKLCNVAFTLINKNEPDYHEYDYFCFHDVDMLPMTDDCDYSYVDDPIHMAVEVEAHDNKLPYSQYFGGVVLFNKEDFEHINGFSNEYWGWGVSDLDLLYRCEKKNLFLDETYELGNVTNDTFYNIDEVKLINDSYVRKLTSLKFDGKKTYVEIPPYSELDGIMQDSYSISVWANPSDLSDGFSRTLTNNPYAGSLNTKDDMTIFSRPGHHTCIQYISPGRFRATVWDKDKKVSVQLADRIPNNWYHLVLTVDRNNHKFNFYINGIKINDRENSSVIESDELFDYRGKQFYLGQSTYGEHFFEGKLSETAMWNYSLSEDEVIKLYTEGIKDKNNVYNTVDKPKAVWNFKKGYENKLLDITGNKNTAIVKRIETMDWLNEEEVIVGKRIKVPFRNNGVYKSLVHDKDENIVERFHTYDPDVEENLDIFQSEVLTGELNINKIGLSNLEYKFISKESFMDRHEWIRVIT